MIESITSITAAQLPINGSQNINKNNINLTIARTTMDFVSTNFESSGTTLQVSNPCSIINRPEGNCSDKVVVSQVVANFSFNSRQNKKLDILAQDLLAYQVSYSQLRRQHQWLHFHQCQLLRQQYEVVCCVNQWCPERLLLLDLSTHK